MSEKKKSTDNEENIIEVLKKIFKIQDEKFQLLEQHLSRISEQIDQLKIETKSGTYTKGPVSERTMTDASIPELRPQSYRSTSRSTTPFNVSSTDIPTTSTSTSKPEIVLPKIHSTAGMVETPLRLAEESFKTDTVVDEFNLYRKEKARMESDTINNYLKKIERVTEEKWLETKKVFAKKDYIDFISLALSVLHGIIEYYYVNYRHEIPENINDYITKAKSISSINVFKDINLLNKMESVYSELEIGHKPMLAPVVMNGWYERLNRIMQEWERRRKEQT